MKSAEAPHVLVLAAGAGDGKNAALSRALQPVFFKPMIRHVLDAAAAIAPRSLGVVLGPGERELREKLRDYERLSFFPLKSGTGGAEAVLAASEHLGGLDGDVLVLSASAPLVTRRSIAGLWARHAESGAACTAGVPAGLYAFDLRALFAALGSMPPGPEGGERRLSDVVAAFSAGGMKTADYLLEDPGEMLEVGDLYDLSRAEAILRARFNRELMLQGVSMQDPPTTLIDPCCRIEPGVLLEGGVTLINSSVGRGSRIKQGSRIEDARIGRDCVIGPCAHLRHGTVLGDEVRVGNFVEIKNSSVAARTKVSHLSYIGDAEIGRNVNVGCGFITCNSDGGPVKQRTVVEDDVFIGSGSQAIAPVRLGAGSFIATGTSITDDVPPGAFAISRGRQVTKAGYAKKYGRRKASPAP